MGPCPLVAVRRRSPSRTAERTGLVAAVVATGWAARRHRPCSAHRASSRRSSTCAAFAVFGSFALIELLGDSAVRSALDDQGRGLAAAILAAVMLISAAVHPFTEQYTLADVPATYRSSPVFRSVHRDLSIRWGCTIAVVAISYLVEADVRAAQGSDVVAFALTWLVPLGVVAIAPARARSPASVGERPRAAPEAATCAQSRILSVRYALTSPDRPVQRRGETVHIGR